MTQLKLSPEKIMEAFPVYRPEQLTSKSCISNLHEKLEDNQFTADISTLIRNDAPDYNAQDAGKHVEEVLLSKL